LQYSILFYFANILVHTTQLLLLLLLIDSKMYFLLLFPLLYLSLLLLFAWAWLKIPIQKLEKPQKFAKISVIIALRNEEQHLLFLLQDLLKQDFPKDFSEILLVNDHSEDKTVEIILQTIAHNSQFKLLHLPAHTTGKKQAITAGIKAASGELIVCTDGDCRLHSQWLTTIHNFYVCHEPKMISATVLIQGSKSTFFETLFVDFQTLDFMSLIGTGAACVQLGYPTMCNGANLAYTKAVFEEVGGFAGNEHLASGDDEFLLQKIAAKYPQGVKFLKSSSSLVVTEAQKSGQVFFEQRRRWASKWKEHKSLTVKFLAFFIFLFHASSLVLPFLALLYAVGLLPPYFEKMTNISLAFWAIKLLAECIFFAVLLPFFGKIHLFWLVPVASFCYPFYALLVGLAANKKGFLWKGRRY
jgi:cellulose synthase/poly-beta-1,6-N-acetylglucosamine synthase-like glycosyltransferase